MSHTILIHAHHLPEQFGRLCRVLRHHDFDIWANIDARSDISPFIEAAPQVNFIKNRTSIKWGHWSQVSATLNSLAEIVSSGREYGHIIFISGQDYPTRPLSEIAHYLDTHKDSEFIAGVTPEKDPHKRSIWERRYTKQWLFIDSHRDLAVFLSKLTSHLLPDQKPPYPIYKGSQWWNLSMECVRYLLGYCKAHPDIIQSYRHSFCADEMFFQSTLMASPYAEKLTDRNFRYIDWSSLRYPKVLTAEDYEAIIKSDAWFCRKVDMRIDSEILDMLDKRVLGTN